MARMKAPPGIGRFGRRAAFGALALLGACSSSSPITPPPQPTPDASGSDPMWCGRGTDVMGAKPATGFCLKSYAQITESRTITFAPNGDLFVASPSSPAPGGASGGAAAIIVLSDDDHNGVAEEHIFLTDLDATGKKAGDVHGMALGGGYLYFTTKATVWRIAYTDGQRQAVGYPEDLGLPDTYGTGGRWTHGLARSKGGTLYTSRGAYASCTMSPDPGGDITSVNATGGLDPVASGFRNPMYLRCHRDDEVCAAMELGEDVTPGAIEKMLVLHPSTNYGFPCCLAKDQPIDNPMGQTCTDVTKEDASFPLSNTPFGFDWEMGNWPAPFKNGVFVALHGSAYSSPAWQGANIVYAPTDPTTHLPVQDWQVFQGGWGPGGTILDRPTDIAFSPDGRMFIADDASGNIYWMAPTTLAAPAN
jgi:glucose/arabinose dehydrogenase